jgi:hypothetical protein
VPQPRDDAKSGFLIVQVQKAIMSKEFDPYREALVVEAVTIWPDEYDEWEPAERRRIEQRLHADPAQAAELEYLRMHTGFQRQIKVTASDIERLV